MRELFKFVQKYSFLNFFGCFSRFEGVNLKRCKIGCSDVPGQPGKIPCLSPEKMIIFHI